MELLKGSILAALTLAAGMAVSACQTDGDVEPAGRAPAGEEGRAQEPGASGSTTETAPSSESSGGSSSGGSKY